MIWLAEPALRFAQYVLLLGLFGWTAFRVIGLGALSWLGPARPGAIGLAAAIAAPVASTALMLFSIAAMMGQPVSALDWPMVEAMILGTGLGTAFLVRAALLLAALGAVLIRTEKRSGLAIAACCYAGALITLGWSGHAAATEGGLGLFHRLNNGAHLIAAGLWLGAIGWFFSLTVRCQRERDEGRVRDLLVAMHAFALLGVILVGAVALTGLINSQLVFGVANVGAVIGTTYGVLLLIKVLFVLGMLVCGAHNARTSRASLASARSAALDQGSALMVLRRSLAFEFLLGLLVTAMVALLGTLSPTGTQL